MNYPRMTLLAIPDHLAERADMLYAAADALCQSALGVDHATGADLLASELQDRAIAIYSEFA